MIYCYLVFCLANLLISIQYYLFESCQNKELFCQSMDFSNKNYKFVLEKYENNNGKFFR